MFHYEAKIKEVLNDNILTPAYYTEEKQSRDDLIKMWGLKEQDIEWFELYEVINDKWFEL